MSEFLYLLSQWNYIIVIVLMMAGLFIVISRQNFVKKLVGLAIFQTSVFLFYISSSSSLAYLQEKGRILNLHLDEVLIPKTF